MARAAVLYIAMGRYTVFWDIFYKSAEKYLLKNHEKKYFIFTDNPECIRGKNIKVIKREPEAWPFSTMKRFHMFEEISDELAGFDNVFFFNANMKIIRDIGEEIIPGPNNNFLMAGLHPAFYNKNPDSFTYDRNPESTAYIPFGKGEKYYQGCLNGGSAEAFLMMARSLRQAVDTDHSKGIIALWHDESHLNKYLLDKSPLAMTPEYLYPEGWNIKGFSKCIRIMQLDKENPRYGGVKWLRGQSEKKLSSFGAFMSAPLRAMKNIVKGRKWWKGIS